MPTDNNPQDKSINSQDISQEELVSFLEKIINKLNNLVIQINNDTEINLSNESLLINLAEDTDKLLDNLTSQLKENNLESLKENNQQNFPQINDNEWDEILEDKSPLQSENLPNKKQQIKSSGNNILATIKSLITRPIITVTLVTVVIASIFIFNFFGTDSSPQLAENSGLQSPSITEKESLKTENIAENLLENNTNNLEEKSDKIIDKELPENPEIVNKPSEEVEVVEIKPTSELELTPEQSLIASIQNQVAEITQKYADGLILAIEANFPSSYLTITINDSWYQITENEQNKLTQEILEKVKILDFYKLTIIDSKGNLIARNPVVGNEMIIVRR